MLGAVVTRLRCAVVFVAGYCFAVSVAYTLDEVFGVSVRNHGRRG